MEAMLKAAEVSALTGLTPRRVRQLANGGQYRAELHTNERGRPMLLIPLSGLPEDVQRRYFEQKRSKVAATAAPISAEKPQKKTKKATPAAKSLEQYTAEERWEISYWMNVVERWQSYRSKAGTNKAACDDRFVRLLQLEEPERNISVGMLYRHWNAIKTDDWDALVDKRGKMRKGKSAIPQVAWDAFLYYYLDQRQSPIQQCYEQTTYFLEDNAPELLPIPSYSTFYRHVMDDVPEAIKVMGRKGPKAFYDRCSHYIRREYDTMVSNEYWIADTHTFDVMTQGGNGKPHRLYLTAFMDARSGIFVGCHVSDTNSSQNVLVALRRGILRYGLPDNIYVDNGREYLNKDVGGTGHRTKGRAKNADGNEWRGWDDTKDFVPPPIFTRMGIKMTNAIVRNARAKTIERRFCDVKNQISRLFDTFCGGTVVEKPEQLKQFLKNGEVVLDSDFTANVQLLLDGLMNESAYNGPVKRDQGKTKMQVWTEHLDRQRICKPEDLNLMLMRSSRPLTVGRNGITATLYGAKLDYYTDEFTMRYQGDKVYYRYDPDDLRMIRAYNLDDQFICELPCRDDMVLKYGANRESVQAAVRELRSYTRMVKNTANATAGKLTEVYGEQKALDVCLAKAQRNLQARIVTPENVKPPIVELQLANETPLLQAVGSENTVDFSRMTANALKQRRIKEGSFEDENV